MMWPSLHPHAACIMLRQKVTMCSYGSKLAILGDTAKQAFMKVLDTYNPYPDMGWEGAKAFHRSMAKDD